MKLLEGVRVVLGMLGIGLVNATNTIRLVLDRFDVEGIVVSGVAGSPYRIGDVTAATAWREENGDTHSAGPAFLDVARQIDAASLAFTRCTPYPLEPPGDTVCLAHMPALFVGGIGTSADDFGGRPFACSTGDVFGCDIALRAAPADEMVVAVEMETAAVGREAHARGVPFIGFRAVSDGEGDPLGLPGFPLQFFAYYRLGAENAAESTAAFIRRWAVERTTLPRIGEVGARGLPRRSRATM